MTGAKIPDGYFEKAADRAEKYKRRIGAKDPTKCDVCGWAVETHTTRERRECRAKRRERND